MKIITSGLTATDLEVLKAARDLGIETGGYAKNNYRMWYTPAIGTMGGEEYSRPCITLADFGLEDSGRNNHNFNFQENAYNSEGVAWYGKCVWSSVLYPAVESWSNTPVIKNPSPSELKNFCADKKVVYIQTGFPNVDMYKEIVNAFGTEEQKQTLLANKEDFDCYTSELYKALPAGKKEDPDWTVDILLAIAIGTMLIFCLS